MRLSKPEFWVPTFAIIFLTAFFAVASGGVDPISKNQLRQDLAKPDLIVIDVRQDSDWNSTQWKIPGARREEPSDPRDWMAKYPKDKTIVLYCA